MYGRPVPAPWLKWATAAAVAAAVALVGVGVWTFLGSRPAATTPDASAGVDPATASPTPVTRPQRPPRPSTSPPVRPRRLAPTRGRSRAARRAAGAATPTTRRPRPRSASSSRCGARATTRRAARGCDQASRQGLECLFQKGSWAQLRALNRPAILTLTDDLGRNHQVVLTSAQRRAGPARPRRRSARSLDRRAVALLVRRFPAAVAAAARRREVARAGHARRRRELAARQPARHAGPAGRPRRAATSTTKN